MISDMLRASPCVGLPLGFSNASASAPAQDGRLLDRGMARAWMHTHDETSQRDCQGRPIGSWWVYAKYELSLMGSGVSVGASGRERRLKPDTAWARKCQRWKGR